MLIAIAGTIGPSVYHGTGEESLHALQARAFLDGRLDLPEYHFDCAVQGGRIYVPFPPLPALLLLPLVAVGGLRWTNPVLIALLCSVPTALLLRRVLDRAGAGRERATWFTAAFLLGTGYWLSVEVSSSVWFFAHVVATLCVLLAIDEAMARRRGWLVGLYLGLAILSRQMMVLALPFLAALVWSDRSAWNDSSDRNEPGAPGDAERPARRRWAALAGLAAGCGTCLALYLVFNHLRFGDALDTGYGHVRLAGFQAERFARYGLFHPIYVPFNLVQMFVQGFHLELAPPTYLLPGAVRMDPFGTSLTFASPFVFLALLARWRPLVLRAAWLTVIVMLLAISLYITNGWTQSNAQRYALDFLPIVVILAALGSRRVPDALWKGAIVYAILLNVVARFCVPLMNAAGG